MANDNENAIRYLERADELRCISECMKDNQNRQILQRLADDYQRMAETLLKKARANLPISREL